MSDQPEPARTSSESRATVSVRRAPRYFRFMAVGAAVGVLVSIALTFSFPEQEDFSRLQVLGFTGLFIVAIAVALGALVAIAIDRASRRRARTVDADRVEEHEIPAQAGAKPSTDARAEPAPEIEFTAEPVSPPAAHDEKA
ncbi:hypothetical protein [Herbiconiux sp. YIM B11900]|uniref:hypothetical protein n=1 Tax=Herbiconiux sp. YIM B11900 TaxID=3404131 RepID=UPI003F87AF27